MDGSVLAGRQAVSAAPYESVVPLIYEAALAPGGWPVLLASLTKALGGSMAYLRTALPGGRPAIAASHGLGPGAIESYDTQWGALDPFMRAAGTAAWQGPVGLRQGTRPAPDHTAFLSGWLRPNDIDDELCISLLAPAAPCRAVLGIGRTPHCPRFGATERTGLTKLAPHLQRAMAVQRHLVAAPEEAPLAATLDRLAAGVLLVDAVGALAWANRTGQAVLQEADGIGLDRHGRLHAATAAAAEALQRALALAMAGEAAAVPLPRPSARPPLAVLAAPLPPQATPNSILPAPPRARLMLLLTDPLQGAADAALEGRLRSLWGLTTAEAVVAAQTAHGAGLPEVAQSLGLAVTTARTHAQRVFAKAGLRGQADLARQVERLSLLTVGAPARAGAPAPGAPAHSAAGPPAIA